jgi:DNA-binding MarR family transcriptional regulator
MSAQGETAAAAAADSPCREQLLRALADAVRATQRATDAVDEAAAQKLGLNRTDSRCMDILDQHGQMSAGELARESGLSTGAITAVVDRLVRIGYVQRIADPNDRRRVLVGPTEKARADVWELFGPLAHAVRPLLAGYGEADLRLLIDFQQLSRELQERHAAWIRAHELGSGEG